MDASVQRLRPTTVEEVQEAVGRHPRIKPVGNGSKRALARPGPGETVLELGGLAQILEYEPAEYTFTALAGTPVATIQAALAEHGQYLPFDPPLAEQGATLGGTVAAGLSGSGRYRYGGVRDFLLGVRFVDGQGRLVRGGGKVVKNAAGFDFPKLMVGSLGRLGVLVEVSFKVFPRPPAYATLVVPRPSLEDALETLARVATAPLDVEALDLVPGEQPQQQATLHLRLGGLPEVMAARADRLREFVGGGELYQGEEDAALWRQVAGFQWAPADHTVVKIPVTPTTIPALEERLASVNAPRRYTVGGHLAWLAWPGPLTQLDRWLAELGLGGLAILGSAEPVELGVRRGLPFLRRIQEALDPEKRFSTTERT